MAALPDRIDLDDADDGFETPTEEPRSGVLSMTVAVRSNTGDAPSPSSEGTTQKPPTDANAPSLASVPTERAPSTERSVPVARVSLARFSAPVSPEPQTEELSGITRAVVVSFQLAALLGDARDEAYVTLCLPGGSTIFEGPTENGGRLETVIHVTADVREVKVLVECRTLYRHATLSIGGQSRVSFEFR